MSSPRQLNGHRNYPHEGQSYHVPNHGFAGQGSEHIAYSYGFLPMNAVVQPQYSGTYYHNMPTMTYPPHIPPQCSPPYANMPAAQDPSIVCYACCAHQGNSAHPMVYYPPPYMGAPEHYPVYAPSNLPSPPIPQTCPQPSVPLATIPPPLEYRRNSCSSAESIAAPQTPSLSSTCVESTPSIAGDSSHGMPLSPASDRYHAPGFPTLKHEKLAMQTRFNANKFPPPSSSPPTKNSLYNPSKTTNVYIRGLAPSVDDDKLLSLVESYGKIASHKAIMDKTTGFCKGYGFALFENLEDAKACILGMAKVNLDAGFARESFNSRLKSLGDPNSTNLYVSNLPKTVDEAQMAEIFRDYQTMSVRILRDDQGVSRGVGFVRFATHEICDQVIAEFNDKAVIEGHAEIQVRYADTYAQKTLKEATTRIRNFYVNEQKRALATNGLPEKVPTGPKLQQGGAKRWAGPTVVASP